MKSDQLQLKLSICLHIVVQLFDVWFVEWMDEWMNEWMIEVININIYSQTEIMPWVTAEELEN
jgi:hypothetical protein